MSEYRCHADIEVRFRDLDAMGHVNNAVYLTYLEVARQAYWRTLGTPVRYDRVPFVVARASLDFRAPVGVGETVRVFLRTAWAGNRSFGMEYTLRERDADRLVAEASTVLVTYDWTAQRAMPIPDWLRSALEGLEGRALPGKPADA
jgi:acyl-CoA thioester hydrolase